MMNNQDTKKHFEDAVPGETLTVTYDNGDVQSYLVKGKMPGSTNYIGIVIPGDLTIYSDSIAPSSIRSITHTAPPKRVPTKVGSAIRVTRWGTGKSGLVKDWTAMLVRVPGNPPKYHISVDSSPLYTPETLQSKFADGSFDFEVMS